MQIAAAAILVVWIFTLIFNCSSPLA